MMETREFRLARFEREARQLATCTGCYGSGADRHVESRACAVCKGAGRAAREPHVVELVELLRAADAEAERLRCRVAFLDGVVAGTEHRATQAEVEAAELRVELDRVRGDLYRARHDARRES